MALVCFRNKRQLCAIFYPVLLAIFIKRPYESVRYGTNIDKLYLDTGIYFHVPSQLLMTVFSL